MAIATPQRVLITGSSKGIGRATAERFLRAGAQVVLNGRREAELEATREQLSNIGPKLHVVAGDVSDAASAADTVSAAVAKLGGLDVLVNNAGIAMRGRFDETAPSVWERVFATNVLGTAYMTRAALPHLRESRGSAVFVSSLVALWGFPLVSTYAASKMALDGLVDSLRTELQGSGVHLGILYVGITQNDDDKRILDAAGQPLPLAARGSATPQSRVAEQVYRLVRRRRPRRVLTLQGKLLNFVVHAAPWIMRLGMRFAGKRIRKLAK